MQLFQHHTNVQILEICPSPYDKVFPISSRFIAHEVAKCNSLSTQSTHGILPLSIFLDLSEAFDTLDHHILSDILLLLVVVLLWHI